MSISVVGTEYGSNSVSIPSGTVDGDLLIWWAGYGGSAANITPEGFTLIERKQVPSQTTWGLIAYRIACDEPATHYVDTSYSESMLITYRKTRGEWINILTSSDLHDYDYKVFGNPVPAGTVTPLTGDDLVVLAFYQDGAGIRTVNPSGYTYSGGGTKLYMYHKLAGTIDPATGSQSFTTTSNGIGMSLILSTSPIVTVQALAGFSKRIKTEVDYTKVRGDVWDYPLLISLSGTAGSGNVDTTDIFDTIGSNYKKIAVTTYDGITQLPVEVEKWDATSKYARLWVKTPGISNTESSIFYVYYSETASDNNTYVGDPGSAVGITVWSEYEHVWHLSNDPSDGAGCIIDSTGNQDGDPTGMDETNMVEGNIPGSQALDFSGTGEYVKMPTSGGGLWLGPRAATWWSMEVLVRPGDIAAESCFPVQCMLSLTQTSAGIRLSTGGLLGGYMAASFADRYLDDYSTGLTLEDDEWYFAVCQYSGQYLTRNWFRNELMLNGTWERVLDGEGKGSRYFDLGAYVGGYENNQYEYAAGETRLASKVRVRSWHEMTYEAMFDTLNIYTMEDSSPPIPTVVLGGVTQDMAEMKFVMNGTKRAVGSLFAKGKDLWKLLDKFS